MMHVVRSGHITSELCVTAYLCRLENRAGAQMVAQMRVAETPLGLTDCRGRGFELVLGNRMIGEQSIQMSFFSEQAFTERDRLGLHRVEHRPQIRSLIRGKAQLVSKFEQMSGAWIAVA